MNEKIIIETNVSEIDGVISQEVLREFRPGITEIIIKQVFDTREEQTRQALIKLGWTPPKG
jgi:hypothetical protein